MSSSCTVLNGNPSARSHGAICLIKNQVFREYDRLPPFSSSLLCEWISLIVRVYDVTTCRCVVETRKYSISNWRIADRCIHSKHWKESYTLIRQSLQSLSLFRSLSCKIYVSLSHNVACLSILLWPIALISLLSSVAFSGTNTMRKRCSKELEYYQKRVQWKFKKYKSTRHLVFVSFSFSRNLENFIFFSCFLSFFLCDKLLALCEQSQCRQVCVDLNANILAQTPSNSFEHTPRLHGKHRAKICSYLRKFFTWVV